MNGNLSSRLAGTQECVDSKFCDIASTCPKVQVRCVSFHDSSLELLDGLEITEFDGDTIPMDLLDHFEK